MPKSATASGRSRSRVASVFLLALVLKNTDAFVRELPSTSVTRRLKTPQQRLGHQRHLHSENLDPIASAEALDALIARKDVKQYYTKSNLEGALQVLFHATLFSVAAMLPYVSTVAMAFVSSTIFCGLHECVHRTAFRSPKANQAWAHIFGFLTLRPARHYLFYHTQHHKYTGSPELDSELQSGSFLDFPVTNLQHICFTFLGFLSGSMQFLPSPNMLQVAAPKSTFQSQAHNVK